MVQVTDYAGQCVKSKRPEAAEGLYMSASRVLDPNLEYYYYLGPTELRKSCFSVIKSYQLTPLACCSTFTSTLSGTKDLDFCNSQYQVDQKADRPTSSSTHLVPNAQGTIKSPHHPSNQILFKARSGFINSTSWRCAEQGCVCQRR